MNNNKDCQVGQLTRSLPLYPVLIDAGPEKSTLRHITENLPLKLRENYASCVSQLLSEAAEEYEVGWSLALDLACLARHIHSYFEFRQVLELGL